MKTIYKGVLGVAALAMAAGSVVMELSSANASSHSSSPTAATSNAALVSDSVSSPAVGSTHNEITATPVLASTRASHPKLGAVSTALTNSAKPSINGSGSSGYDDESDDAISEDAQDD